MSLSYWRYFGLLEARHGTQYSFPWYFYLPVWVDTDLMHCCPSRMQMYKLHYSQPEGNDHIWSLSSNPTRPSVIGGWKRRSKSPSPSIIWPSLTMLPIVRRWEYRKSVVSLACCSVHSHFCYPCWYASPLSAILELHQQRSYTHCRSLQKQDRLNFALQTLNAFSSISLLGL